MTKDEMKQIKKEVLEGKVYEETDSSALLGLALPSFENRKPVSKEAAVNHVRWQAENLDGSIDREALSHNLRLMKKKQVIII